MAVFCFNETKVKSFGGLLACSGGDQVRVFKRVDHVFYLSKIIAIILHPIHLFLLLLVAFSLLSSWQLSHALKRNPCFPADFGADTYGFVGFNLSVPILPYQAVRALEHRFPQPQAEDLNLKSLLLGGGQGSGASFSSANARPSFSRGSSDRRIDSGSKFPKKLYFPGGLKMDQIGVPKMRLAVPQLRDWAAIVSNDHRRRIRNTAENAVGIRAMMDDLQQGQLVLITSASHMPRAISSFRKGFNFRPILSTTKPMPKECHDDHKKGLHY